MRSRVITEPLNATYYGKPYYMIVGLGIVFTSMRDRSRKYINIELEEFLKTHNISVLIGRYMLLFETLEDAIVFWFSYQNGISAEMRKTTHEWDFLAEYHLPPTSIHPS